MPLYCFLRDLTHSVFCDIKVISLKWLNVFTSICNYLLSVIYTDVLKYVAISLKKTSVNRTDSRQHLTFITCSVSIVVVPNSVKKLAVDFDM